MNNNISQNLYLLRKKFNLSQSDLANKLNISRQALSNYENGTRTPTIDLIIEIARIFNCSLDELVNNQSNLSNEKISDLLNIKFLNFSKNDLLKSLKNKKKYMLQYQKEIPKKLKEIDELIEFLESKNCDEIEKNNTKKELKKEINKNKKDTEIGEELFVEDIYLENFNYFQNKYGYNNIINLFRPVNELGEVSCGNPRYAFENIENTFLLPKYSLLEKEKYFILKAKGDSMNKLFDIGEKLLIRQINSANDGDIVIAFIPDGEEATCKKYYEDGDNISLVPCSTNEIHKVQNYKANEVCILGIVISKLDDFLEDVDFEELEENVK